MAGKFSVEGVFKLTDRMTRGVAKIESRVQAFARSVSVASARMGQRMSKMWERASTGFKALGGAAVVAGAAATGVLVQVMRQGMDFEKTLLDAGNKFEPGIKKNSELFKKLSAAAQDVGGKTEFSASQSAMALNDLAGAGFNADQAIAGLPKVVNFATAASLELSEASEVAAKSLGAFDMKSNDPKVLADNLGRVTDVLMKTDALSSTNMAAIFEAMKEGGPVAKSAGASLETFAAMVATLGTAGIEGSTAGTTLKNVFLSLAKPTTEAAGALAQLGIKTKDAQGNLRDTVAILGELRQKTAKMGTADKSGVLESVFGKIPIAGVNVMLDKIDDLKKGREELSNAGGQVDLVAGSKRQSTQGSWDSLTSGLEAVSLAVFEVIGGPMKEMMDATAEWIGKFKTEAIPFVTVFVDALGEGFRQVWPALKGALDLLSSGLGSKAEFLQTTKTLATHLGRVAAALVAVGAVVGGMVLAAFQAWAWVVEKQVALFNALREGAGAAIFAISDMLSNIAAKWRAFNFAEWGMQIVRGIANGIKAGAQWVMDAIGSLADDMVNRLKGALDMRSPSRRTALIGDLAAQGIGVGVEEAMPKVNADITHAIETMPLLQPIVPPAPVMPAVNALSLGNDLAPSPTVQPQLMSQEERLAAANAQGDLGRGEIVIRDETGKAEVTEQPKRTKLTIEPARSGTF
jgi:TP901 family phage tail tape measure protein